MKSLLHFISNKHMGEIHKIGETYHEMFIAKHDLQLLELEVASM